MRAEREARVRRSKHCEDLDSGWSIVRGREDKEGAGNAHELTKD